jgi:arylsulfatase
MPRDVVVERRTLSALLVVACVALWGCPPPEESGGAAADAGDLRSIVIVSIDTLRADHLGCYGYFRDTSPTIDRLAEESILFERAVAPMAVTLPAHTSLLTGTDPLEHGVLANIRHGGRVFVPAPGLRSFVEIARDRGYRTAGFVSAPPLASSTGIAAGFDVFGEPEKARTAGETNAEVFAWIDGMKPGPFLLWVHYFDPHQPYRPPEAFASFRDDEALERYLSERDIADRATAFAGRPYDTRESTNLYDGEIRYVDHELGRLIERLRQADRWDDAAVLLISDHGESIGDHGLMGHEYITREQLQVLMLLRVPDVPPRSIDTPGSLVDALPTLIPLLGDDGWQEFLEQASGRDLLAVDSPARAVLGQRGDRARPDFIGPGYSLLSGSWRYHYEPEKKNRLYDWDVDPHELTNLIERHPERARSMEAELLQRVVEYQARGAERRGDGDPVGDVDPELYERLRALGYVDE